MRSWVLVAVGGALGSMARYRVEDQMVGEGLVTLERAEVILYRAPAKPRG